MQTETPSEVKQARKEIEPKKAGMLYVYNDQGHLIFSGPYYKTPEGVMEVEKA